MNDIKEKRLIYELDSVIMRKLKMTFQVMFRAPGGLDVDPDTKAMRDRKTQALFSEAIAPIDIVGPVPLTYQLKSTAVDGAWDVLLQRLKEKGAEEKQVLLVVDQNRIDLKQEAPDRVTGEIRLLVAIPPKIKTLR